MSQDSISLDDYKAFFYATKPSVKFKRLKKVANEKNLEVTINFKTYSQLIDNPCFYCSGPLSDTGYGLDRLNSALGYTFKNLVACCKGCNTLKSDIHSPEHTKAMVTALKLLKGNDIWGTLAPNRRSLDNLSPKLRTLDTPKSKNTFRYLLLHLQLPKIPTPDDKIIFSRTTEFLREQVDRRRGNLTCFNIKTGELVFKTNNYSSSQLVSELQERAHGLVFSAWELDEDPFKNSKAIKIPFRKKISPNGIPRLQMSYVEAEKGRVYNVIVPEALKGLVMGPGQKIQKTFLYLMKKSLITTNMT